MLLYLKIVAFREVNAPPPPPQMLPHACQSAINQTKWEGWDDVRNAPDVAYLRLRY
jgi:hypothetical protein